MESLNCKMQIIKSMHHNLLWGKFPIQEQTCWLRFRLSNFLMCESPTSKHESSVLTESIKQHSQFASKSWKGVFFARIHRTETLFSASCTVWRDLRRYQKNQMLFLILTPSSFMTLDSFLGPVTQHLFGFLKHWEIRSMQYRNDAVSCSLTINFKQYVSLITLHSSVH